MRSLMMTVLLFAIGCVSEDGVIKAPPDASTPITRCQTGTTMNTNGDCVINQTQCPAGSTRNEAGVCIDDQTSCPTGSSRNQNGVCISDHVAGDWGIAFGSLSSYQAPAFQPPFLFFTGRIFCGNPDSWDTDCFQEPIVINYRWQIFGGGLEEGEAGRTGNPNIIWTFEVSPPNFTMDRSSYGALALTATNARGETRREQINIILVGQ